MKRLLTALAALSACVLFLAGGACAQKNGPIEVYQLSGMALSNANGNPLAFTRIEARPARRFAIANEEGFFSLPVTPRDTLTFSCVGYKTRRIIVADFLATYQGEAKGPYRYTLVKLDEDPAMLPAITIYPYKNAHEIRMAILNMGQNYREPLANASANLDAEVLAYFMNDLPADPQERLRMAQQRYNALYANSYLLPTVGVNPAAVFNLIRYLGRKSGQEKGER